MPPVSVPLLSEHKTIFVWNRFFETLLGGVRLFLCRSDVPVYVYVAQLILHQLPFIIGALFTILNQTGVLTVVTASIICLVVAVIVAASIQIFSVWIHWNVSTVVLMTNDSKQSSKRVVFGDDDDDVTFDSQFSFDSARRLLPRKRFLVNVVLHAVLWALLTAYGVSYLSPSWLEELFGSAVNSYVYSSSGWMVVCISLYSLMGNVPAEPSTFHPLDPLELRCLNRPFYLAVLYLPDLVTRCTGFYYEMAFISRVVFIVLPLLWFLNILPPLDALFVWAGEQFLFVVAGGTPTSSNKRLSFHLLVWFVSFAIIYIIPSVAVQTTLSAVLGYILSLDLNGLARIITQRHKSVDNNELKELRESKQHLLKTSRWTSRDVIFFAIMLFAVAITSVSLHFVITNVICRSSTTLLGVVLAACLAFTWFARSFSSVFIFVGLLRNPFYDASRVQHGEKHTKKFILLNLLKKCHLLVTSIRNTRQCFTHHLEFTPLFLMFYVHFLVCRHSKSEDTTTVLMLIHTACVLRAFRWVWQQTDFALFETVIVHFLAAYIVDDVYDELLLLVIAAFFHDRFWNFVSKLFVACNILFASVTQDKQKRSYSWVLFVVFFILLLSSLLSAPLLPLFTLPLFWIGFPRPASFWPKQEDVALQPSSDAIYYEEVIDELLRGLEVCLIDKFGSKPGDHFLIRYDDRLAVLSIVASGYGYLNVRVKGLELQQTSCHTLEANTVDAIIDRAFDRTSLLCRVNRDAFHVFQPLDVVQVETYVDTRNVLTGVINSPETLQLISDSFIKCLIWMLMQHINRSRHLPEQEETKEVVAKSRPSTADKYAQLLPKAPSLSKLLVHENVDDVAEKLDPWHDDEDDLLGEVTRSRPMTSEPSKILISEMFQVPGVVVNSGEYVEPDDDTVTNYVPREWLKCPVPEDHVRFVWQQFPFRWFRYVFGRFRHQFNDDGSSDDVILEQSLRRVVLCCHIIVNQVGTTGLRLSVGPSTIARIFAGDIPWSPHSEWLLQQTTLFDLVIKAYRYACKVAIDQVLLGEAESDEELADYLDDYDRSWHIGPDSNPAWIEAIQCRTSNLFSLDYCPVLWTHTSHLLTRQTVPVYIGRLDSEAVRSVWSTLSLELLYLTNDDEERYSIQAHSGILRNLIVQSADPPLGYPIFVSPTHLLRLMPTSYLSQT